MDDFLKFHWRDFESRLLKLSRPTDWAYLPNNKEREIYSLVTPALRRLPMQPPWHPAHPDMRVEDFHQRYPTRALLLITDAAWQEIVLAYKIADNMEARALSRYLAVKKDEELAALHALALEEAKLRQAMQKQRQNALRQEMIIRLASLEEHDRIARRHVEELEQSDTAREAREQLLREAMDFAFFKRKARNRAEIDERDRLQHERTRGMQEDMAFQADKRATHNQRAYDERDADWRERRALRKQEQRAQQIMPEREKDSHEILAALAWAYAKRDTEALRLRSWQEEVRDQPLHGKVTPKTVEDVVFGTRGAPQREADRLREDRVTDSGRSQPPVDSAKLDEAAGRSAYRKAIQRTRSG